MMWGYYNNGFCDGFWPGNIIGILFQILIAVILIAIIVKVVRKSKTWHLRGNSAEELLKERFVKGEISKEEYEEKLKVITQ